VATAQIPLAQLCALGQNVLLPYEAVPIPSTNSVLPIE